MQTVLLNEANLESIVLEVKKKHLSLSDIDFRYNPNDHFLLLKPSGVPGISQDADYFENFRDNLEYADFSWLSPLCDIFKMQLDAKVKILPDGSFSQTIVPLQVRLNVPKKVQESEKSLLKRFLYPRLENFLKFKDYVRYVEVNGMRGNIHQITFYMEIDPKKVNAIISKESSINISLIEQWIATFGRVEKYSGDSFNFSQNLPVVNGKLQYDIRKECLSFKFNHMARNLK